MSKLWDWIWNGEPAVVLQVPAVTLAAAAGVWTNEWLAFGAAASAAIGALATRANVTPTSKPFGGE